MRKKCKYILEEKKNSFQANGKSQWQGLSLVLLGINKEARVAEWRELQVRGFGS